MATLHDVQIGQRFSFEVYPTAILGNNFKDVRLEGILSARTALASGVDIESLHRNVYPSLPAGVPNDPFQYNFIKIQHANGEYTYIGVPYIRSDSIEVSTGGTINLVFQDKTQTDLDRILLALSASGYAPDSTSLIRS